MTNKSNDTNNVDGDDNVMETRRGRRRITEKQQQLLRGQILAVDGSGGGSGVSVGRVGEYSGRTLIGICINLYERNHE